MKLTPILSLVVATGLIAGCQSSGSSHQSPAAKSSSSVSSYDTSSLVAAFKNADKDSNQTVQNVVSALGKKDYSGAKAELQKLNQIPGLTSSQATAVQQLLAALAGQVK